MRTVDRQGIHIDQCDGCRGIFLDRGELESILTAEQRYSAAAVAPPPYQGDPYRGAAPPPPMPGRRYGDSPRGYSDSPRGHVGGYGDSPRGYGGHGGHGAHGKRRRKSFLEELFD
jgi:Zn-finger nucleic acid-binding protein